MQKSFCGEEKNQKQPTAFILHRTLLKVISSTCKMSRPQSRTISSFSIKNRFTIFMPSTQHTSVLLSIYTALNLNIISEPRKWKLMSKKKSEVDIRYLRKSYSKPQLHVPHVSKISTLSQLMRHPFYRVIFEMVNNGKLVNAVPGTFCTQRGVHWIQMGSILMTAYTEIIVWFTCF